MGTSVGRGSGCGASRSRRTTRRWRASALALGPLRGWERAVVDDQAVGFDDAGEHDLGECGAGIGVGVRGHGDAFLGDCGVRVEEGCQADSATAAVAGRGRLRPGSTVAAIRTPTAAIPAATIRAAWKPSLIAAGPWAVWV